MDLLGLAAATSGNYSVRLSDARIAITVSGAHKGRLRAQDVMLVSAAGAALQARRPSAETALHTSLYALYEHVNAVLHVHSVAGVVLTRHLSGARELVLQGYEMLKAFPGIGDHDSTVSIAIYDNCQDVEALAQHIAHRLRAGSQVPAYLIRGHGAYAWGRDMQEAERVVEALEYLLRCELAAMQLRAGARP